MNSSFVLGTICTIPKTQMISVGDDPTTICTFVVAVESTTENEDYEFFECCAFGHTAISVTNKFAKNSKVLIRGKFKNFKFEDQLNNKHFTNILCIESVEYGDSMSEIDGIKKKKSDAAFINTKYHQIDEMYIKAQNNGFNLIDEGDYYRLALSLFD